MIGNIWEMGSRISHAYRANTRFLCNTREYNGHFYLFYAGRTHGFTHAVRGNNKLRFSLSNDLQEKISISDFKHL